MIVVADAIIAAWILTALLASFGVIRYRLSVRSLSAVADPPSAAVIVAIKGVSARLPDFLDALLGQTYPHYRIVFAVEAQSDPAFAALEFLARDADGRIELVIAGIASERAQKVHNLLAALAALQPQDGIVVFADADIVPPADWLQQLTRPIALRRARVTSGYRWQTPADCRLATKIVTLADMSIATAARDARWNLCWGGSTAIERSLLDSLDLPTLWARVASDDLTLTKALRTTGVPVHGTTRVLVPSPVAYSWSGVFSFGRRQYLLLRCYAPRHWLLAGWTLCVPMVGAALAASTAWAGSLGAALSLGSAVMLRLLRHRIRLSIARRTLSPEIVTAVDPSLQFGWWGWPLVHAVHTAVFLGSLFGREFCWAGIRYRLRHDGEVVIQGRSG
jgi:hypothetical protein